MGRKRVIVKYAVVLDEIFEVIHIVKNILARSSFIIRKNGTILIDNSIEIVPYYLLRLLYHYFNFPYSSSETGSHHSVPVSSPGTSIAR